MSTIQTRNRAKVLADYEIQGRAVRAKTARLRALRLAKEAAETSAELIQKPAQKLSK